MMTNVNKSFDKKGRDFDKFFPNEDTEGPTQVRYSYLIIL